MAIEVSTEIPYGNACDVEVVEDGGRVEVRFAADPHGATEAMWFCLRASQGIGWHRHSGTMRLVLKHFRNLLGSHNPEKLRPVVRYTDGDWRRLPAGTGEETADGRTSVWWDVEAPDRWLELALCYPYGDEDVDQLVADTGGFYQVDTIGVSAAGRPIRRLSNGYGEKGSDRPGLYLVARQHSGETPGSWVLDGALRRFAGMGDRAPMVWAVPLSNIDGVVDGDYGKDPHPYDLNRSWGMHPMRYEVLVIQRDMARWKERCRPALGFDFHAPGMVEDEGAYVFLPKPEVLPEKHETAKGIADAMAARLGEYAAKDFGRVARYSSRWETPTFTQFFCGTLDVCGFSMETPYSLIGEKVLTREDYREIGARVAEAALNQKT